MIESIYTQTVLRKFQELFPSNWLEDPAWNEKSGKKKLFSNGITRITVFRDILLENYARLVLSADFLVSYTKEVDELDTIVTKLIEDFIPEKKGSLKNQLICSYQSMLSESREIIYLTKSHIRYIENHFSVNNNISTFDFVLYNEIDFDKRENYSLLNIIIDACNAEYNFSFDNSYIKQLLLRMQHIKNLLKERFTTGYKNKLLKVTLVKIELLLGKLSVFSKNKEITYNFDFEPGSIRLENYTSYKEEDFRSLFLLYLDPKRIEYNTIRRWQDDSHKKDVKMWQIAFLMRYYTKCTKSTQQVDRILQIAEDQNNDYYSKDDHNIVNDYAARSFINYMYNSRFSFLCQNSTNYTYKEMSSDLEMIKTIQNETFIFNYHPFQKAIEFSLNLIDRKLKSSEFDDDLSAIMKDLKNNFSLYKQNIEWSKSHQPFLMQLRYNFSCIEIEDTGITTYCPSSFCRPIRFNELQEKVQQFAGKIAILDYEVEHLEEKKELIDAKKKVENMERRNMETMGLFITVTTFLVGLLSIFIGNNGSVSIFEKMHYVITLGTILLLFVCLGYFIVGDALKKKKPIIFGTLTVAFIVILGIYYFITAFNNTEKQENASINSTINVVPKSKPFPVIKPSTN